MLLTPTLHRARRALLWITLAGVTACQPSEPARTGLLELNDYQQIADFELQGVAREASGLAYDPLMDALWLVHDDPTTLVLLDTQGGLRGRWPLTGFNDPEAVAVINTTKTGQRRLVVSDERNGRIVEVHVDPENPESAPTIGPIVVQLDKQGNRGIEGLDYRAGDHSLWLVSEHYPQAAMHLSSDRILTERWRSWPWQRPWDYSGLAYVEQTDTLLILSRSSKVLLEYDLQGNRLGQLHLKDIGKAEGVALAPDGRLFICAEPNRLYIFEPRNAPEQGI